MGSIFYQGQVSMVFCLVIRTNPIYRTTPMKARSSFPRA
jgi:hypothetical protein